MQNIYNYLYNKRFKAKNVKLYYFNNKRIDISDTTPVLVFMIF